MAAATPPNRFRALWDRTIGDGNSDEAWRALDRGYGERARAYPGWLHIDAMLQDVDRARDDPSLPAPILDNLVRNDDTGTFDLIWSRPKRRSKAGRAIRNARAN